MHLAHQAGIRVFATGGIGGLHRSAADSFDISADLVEFARTPVLVVCAGAKSILDLPKTLECSKLSASRCLDTKRTDSLPSTSAKAHCPYRHE